MARWTATVLALLAAALAPGCGNDERDSVERYIGQANAVQKRYAPRLAEANDAYARFAKGELDAMESDLDLTAAEQALRDARAELARLDPPDVAAELHRRLLRVFELNADFAAESTALARYLPEARRVLEPVGGIARTLRSRLRSASGPSAQADALGDYSRAMERRLDALSELEPPPVLVATHRSQLGRLFASSRLAGQLRAASAARDSQRVAELLLEFRRVSRQSGDAGLTRRAVRDYGRRHLDISRAELAMQREQVRLEQRFD